VGQMLDLFVEVGWSEALALSFSLDLLFYHAHLHCYVVIDLKLHFFAIAKNGIRLDTIATAG
jgi:predicted nuclease of restriction endonuclease-like (RecB) superfamily